MRVGSSLGLAVLVAACSSGAVGSAPGPNLATVGSATTDPEGSTGNEDEGEEEEAGGVSSSEPEETTSMPSPGCMNGIVESGEFCFFELLYTDGIPGASWIASGSFDGDADADLAVAAQSQGAVYLLFGDGTGNFLFDQFYDVGMGVAVVATGAFDDWSLPDLITSDGGASTLSLLLNTGTGEFTAGTPLNVVAAPMLLAIDDFNTDGLADVAVSHADDTAQVSVLLGSTTGLMPVATVTLTGGDALGLDAADLNGDGNVDLVAGIENVDEVVILSGDGLGAFAESARFPAGGESPLAVAVQDLDGDGTPEIAIGNAFPEDPDAGNLHIVDFDGAGWVSSQLLLSDGAGAMDFGDFDADGDVDIALSTLDGGSVQVFAREDGELTLKGTFGLEAPAEPFGIVAEDFNSDGITDIATADRVGNRIALLLAEP